MGRAGGQKHGEGTTGICLPLLERAMATWGSHEAVASCKRKEPFSCGHSSCERRVVTMLVISRATPREHRQAVILRLTRSGGVTSGGTARRRRCAVVCIGEQMKKSNLDPKGAVRSEACSLCTAIRRPGPPTGGSGASCGGILGAMRRTNNDVASDRRLGTRHQDER